jgi:hypothetical protein
MTADEPTGGPPDDLYGGIFWVRADAEMRSATPGESAAEIARLRAAVAGHIKECLALRAELDAYRDARQYDACMGGPVFMGWNRSQLDRARRMTEEHPDA